MVEMSRRRWLAATLGMLGAFRGARFERALAEPTDLKLPENVSTCTLDFESAGVDDWTVVSGQWSVEEIAGAPSGRRAQLVQVSRATITCSAYLR
jgi:hypothetical protein